MTAKFEPMGTWDVGDEFDHRLALALAGYVHARLLDQAVADVMRLMRESRERMKG